MKKDEAEASAGAGASNAAPSQKYVPPNVREGGNRRGESMNSKGKGEYRILVLYIDYILRYELNNASLFSMPF